ERAHLQAMKFGARLAVPGRAVGIAEDDGHYAVELADGVTVRGRTVVVATGAQYRRLDIPDLDRFEGNGVYYAATQAEAQLCFGADRPFFLETSRPGIFAVGDVHSGSIKRDASAVGEGSMTIRLVHQRLADPR